MFIRTKKRGERTYLMIVENRRINGKVTQEVLHHLGRLDILQKSGKLDALLNSLGRFSQNLTVMGAHCRGESITTQTTRIGPSLIFERLWKELGIDQVLKEELSHRKFEFSVERAVFLTVLHRLFDPGSDRAAEKWKKNYALSGAKVLSLHHLYRAMAWLGTPLSSKDQSWASPFTPRCVKDRIEENFFSLRQDLFSGLEVVFFDTTSIYFEGEGDRLGKNGHSKDHRPDLKQMVVGIVLDNQGHPICSEMWPGNTTDVKTLIPIVQRLQNKFGVCNMSIVADRGMISKETIAEMDQRNWGYILGVRMRQSKEAQQMIDGAGDGYEEVYPKSSHRKAPSPLKVQERVVNGHRYILCLNTDQATKDRQDREAILSSLREALKRGDKSLIGNKGYRRYVQTSRGHFSLDENKIKEEQRYDGKWILITNGKKTAREVALQYKQLWLVEDVIRSMKSVLETRPIYHQNDETIHGHVFCSFLALVLRKELQDRLESKGYHLEWADIINDLDELLEMEITVQKKGYCIRSEAKGTVGKVSQVCGVALPPVVRPCLKN